MNQNLKPSDVSKVLAAIRQDISNANSGFYRSDFNTGDKAWYLQSAYARMRILLEALGLMEAVKAVQQVETAAATKWDDAEVDGESGEPYLVWGARLGHYVLALETTLGRQEATTVSKDVVEILRATQYSITDRSCFENPPANEKDVHVRIEAVLRCVFPDLRHKPPIAKQIKNFVPDTGLPSIQTLVEYKFMGDQGEENRIADEILADTRGYVSEEWKKFVYVIYETKRIKPESQWRQLLRESGLDSNTEVIVISGEPPRRKPQAALRLTKNAPESRPAVTVRDYTTEQHTNEELIAIAEKELRWPRGKNAASLSKASRPRKRK